MSRDPQATALKAARRYGVPYCHREGPLVVLVLHGEGNPITGEQRGTVCTWMCASSGLAASVEARALADLATFGEEHANTLAVSVMYAEAALRNARRRRRAA